MLGVAPLSAEELMFDSDFFWWNVWPCGVLLSFSVTAFYLPLAPPVVSYAAGWLSGTVFEL